MATETQEKTEELLAVTGAEPETVVTDKPEADAPKAEANPEPDQTTEQQDAEMTAAFRKLSGEEAETDGEPAEDKEAVAEKPAADKVEAKAAKTEDGAKPEPSVVEASRSVLEGVKSLERKLSKMSDEDIVKAADERVANALKRWKYPDDVIAGLTPQRRLELGATALAEQAKQDAEGNRRKEIEEVLKAIESERQSPESAAKGSKAGDKETAETPVEPPASTEDIQAIFDSLSDEDALVWSDFKEPLQRAVEASTRSQVQTIVDRVARQYEAKIAEVSKQAEETERSLLAQIDRIELRMARDMLRAEIPQLADPEKWKAVQKRTYSLANLNGYTDEDGNPDVVRLVKDAAGLEFKDTIKQDFQDGLRGKYAKQVNGQPADLHAGEAPGAALDEDAQMTLAVKLLNQGKSADEVQRIIASRSAK